MRVTALLEARFRQLNGLERERMKRFEPLVHSLGSDPEQVHLLTLLLDDCYQKNLNPEAFLPAGSVRKEPLPARGENARWKPAWPPRRRTAPRRTRGRRRSPGKEARRGPQLQKAQTFSGSFR
ncbi:MAG: hypothetical protein V8Q84_05180 [Bilophila sp.]